MHPVGRELPRRSRHAYVLLSESSVARDSPLGDLSRCRLSATDFFNVKYALHSSAMLRDVLASYGLKAPKSESRAALSGRSLLQRKMAVADLLDKELKEAFTVPTLPPSHS